MPISGVVMGSQISAAMFSNGLVGENVTSMSNAIGSAVANNFLTSGLYVGASTGLGLGAGVSTGKITGGITIAPALSGLILTQMFAFGLVGESTPKLANAIGSGVANHMNLALVQGASTVVGIGTGTGTIVGIIGPVLGGLIFAQLSARGIVGINTLQISQAVGNAIAIATTLSIVNTTIVGAAVGPVPPAFPPVPAVGTDTGKII